MTRGAKAVPIAALSVLGLAVTFGAGWALGSVGGDHLSATRLAAESSAPEADGARGGSSSPLGALKTLPTGGVPTDLPTGELTTSSSSAATSAADLSTAVTKLPSIAKLKKPPVAAFRCPKATVTVSTAKQLDTALDEAEPGTVISLADGTYSDRFTAKTSGTAKKPIYLCGGRGAVLDAGSVTGGYVLHLDGASYWRVSGFTVQDGQKGVVVDGATRVGLQKLLVQNIGDEAVHLRDGTTRSVVRGNTIRHTGMRKPKFGEGVYVGSATKNWCKISQCQPDKSNYNYVLNNNISATSSESVDIKEGTIGGVVAGNTFNGASTTAADSWVDVKGNGWLLSGNQGLDAPYDGYQTHEIVDGWGNYNLFTANVSDVGASGYAFKVTRPMANVVRCDNKQSGAGSGLTNIRCVR